MPGVIENIHFKMLETGNLEDQVNQRPLSSIVASPTRKSIKLNNRRLHANQFLFGSRRSSARSKAKRDDPASAVVPAVPIGVKSFRSASNDSINDDPVPILAPNDSHAARVFNGSQILQPQFDSQFDSVGGLPINKNDPPA